MKRIGWCFEFTKRCMTVWFWWEKEQQTLHWNVFGIGGWVEPFKTFSCEGCCNRFRIKDLEAVDVNKDEDDEENWFLYYCFECSEAMSDEEDVFSY